MSSKIENVVYRHPDAILFLRISREGVFQQPCDISTVTSLQAPVRPGSGALRGSLEGEPASRQSSR